MTRIFQGQLVLSVGLFVCLIGFSEPTFAKNKTKKKTAPVEVTAESRLADWQKSPQADRGTPSNLCERDYKELHVVYDYFSEISRRLKPLSAEKHSN